MPTPGRLVPVLVGLACSAPAPAPLCPAEGPCRYTQTSTFYESNPPPFFDVLVVMDDSASMAARQEQLVAGLAPQLERTWGGLPELRVRVISSSVPAAGLAGF